MATLKIGDRIRFLNTVGGGTVKGFKDKNIVLIEEDDGFETPTLISECILIDAAPETKTTPVKQHLPTESLNLQEENTYESTEIDDPEAEKLTVIFAIIPENIKLLQQTAYSSYLVNDCNYSLMYNIAYKADGCCTVIENGLIEPNTTLLVEEFDGSQLNNREYVLIQLIPLKKGKKYTKKSVFETELRINPVKYCKLHSFIENDYFDEKAMIFHLIEKDNISLPQDEIYKSESDFIKEKESQQQRPRIKSNKTPNPIVEIDLHIDQLLDNKAGMSNADMLKYQLETAEKTINQHKNKKGQKIVFIHGKGNGILRNEIIKLIKHKHKSFTYQDASFREYGFGATLITIR